MFTPGHVRECCHPGAWPWERRRSHFAIAGKLEGWQGFDNGRGPNRLHFGWFIDRKSQNRLRKVLWILLIIDPNLSRIRIPPDFSGASRFLEQAQTRSVPRDHVNLSRLLIADNDLLSIRGDQWPIIVGAVTQNN